MSVRTEAVHIHQLTEDLRRYFQPLVDQKGLKLVVDVLRGCPERSIRTVNGWSRFLNCCLMQ